MVKEAPRIVVDSPIVRVATWREVFIVVWHVPGSVADVSGVYAAQRAFAQRLPRGERIITVSVIGARVAAKLDGDVRREVEKGTREQRERVKGSVVVIAATGFGAAALRSIVAALMLLNRPGYPTQVFGDVAAAARWATTLLTRTPASPVSEADLLEALRAAAQPRP